MKRLTPSAQRILGARNFRHAQVELSTAIDQLYALTSCGVKFL